jgi:hypothetical protein
VAGEEVRPGEHGVVDVPLLGGHRLAVNDAEQPYASLWVGCRSLGRRLGHVRRTLCEGAGAAPSHREAVLAHPPEVDGEEHDEGAWEDGDMQRVEAQQGHLSDLVATDEQVAQRPPEHGHVVDEVGADRDGPVAELVPRQQVAGEGEAEGGDEQAHAEHPVELAGVLVRAREEHPDEVQDDDHHHQVGRPPVDVADELPEADAGAQALHVAVGRGDGGV